MSVQTEISVFGCCWNLALDELPTHAAALAQHCDPSFAPKYRTEEESAPSVRSGQPGCQCAKPCREPCQADDPSVAAPSAAPAQFVIVEADPAAEADHRAKKANVYFDAVWRGIDCRDCGDRSLRASADAMLCHLL